MLFPIGDDNRDRRITPFINYIFILLNLYVFIALQDFATNEDFTYAYSTVPAEILTGEDLKEDVIVEDVSTQQRFRIPQREIPYPVWLTLFTSMFMHGGIAHIFGNMLYLWIFGDNIENRIGHIRYFIFYVLAGLTAALSQVFSTLTFGGNEFIPSLGASGAISGVLGGYLLLFPRRRVNVMFMYTIMNVPAIVALGLWFVFQLISGFGVLGSQDGGVAYAAHIGGFVAGFLTIKLFDIGNKRREVFYR